MTKVKSEYMIGLDIGTNSTGWVATDMQNNILRLNGKTAIGSRLFEEGHTASERRGYRTTRRRLNRRKWRLKFLEEFFDSHMAEVDPYFFARMKESGLSPLDSRKTVSSIIFPTADEDQKFHEDNPTIYHLRNKLMFEDKKFDLREVYLAIHHIVKYRGNFLQDTPLQNFDASKIQILTTISNLNQALQSITGEEVDLLEEKNAEEIETVIRDKTEFKLNKQKKIAKLLVPADLSKENKKSAIAIAKQVANAMMGYKTKFEILTFVDVEKDETANWEFKLTDADSDEKLLALSSDTRINEDRLAILDEIQRISGAITLSTLVDEGKTLSQTMIRKYEDHKEDLRLLKNVINHMSDSKKAKKLRLAYDLYVNNRHGHILAAKQVLKTSTPGNKESFYDVVKKNLDNSDDAKTILDKIKIGSFMPKQRTNANGVIPFQLHQIELDKIINNQSKYYPFLKEKNPIESHRNQAPYKLDELVRFRVPYYVGPMIEPDPDTHTSQIKSNQNFAWMVRKEKGKIDPWNFDQKVDRIESANRFIKRMTTKDTYLLGEDVLPANSLLYQRFVVLNELNNVRINGCRVSVSLKQEIYNNLFKTNSSVTLKKLIHYLKTNHNLVNVEIKGLSDETKFTSSLTTYNKLKNTHLFDDQLENLVFRNDLEKIIEWSTIFEDKSIYSEKLDEIKWLTEKQKKALINLPKMQGWGRLSKKLLQGLHDSNGQNIIEILWNSQQNFMQIVNSPDFKTAIAEENQNIIHDMSIEDILDDAYTSPANKKAIRQVVKVVDDIVKAASGKAPKQIAVEFARDAEQNPKRTKIRGRMLQKVYQDISDELVSANIKDQLEVAVKDRKLIKDKYFLYFMQLGRDAYTGLPINIDEIETGYQIDHILPQSFIKDDSLDNRVLVSSPVNNGKSDNVPVKMFGNNRVSHVGISIKEMWKDWQKKGLISKRKLNNLLLDPENINKYQASGFINRQLVETSQIIKLVSTVLQSKYPDSEIIVVKASANHYLREHFNLYKSREVNDYHHAIDAYLSTICGNLLYQVYPKLRPFFVYGQFKKFSSDPDLEKSVLNHTRRFNFIESLISDKAPDEIKVHKSDDVVFKQSTIKNQLERAYNFKYMLVSREVSTRDQEMFKMTVFPRAERDTSKTRKLISKGKNLPTEIYGGYSNNADAYMAIVRINKKKGSEYRVVGVPMRALTRINNLGKNETYNSVLKEILTPNILYGKNGKKKSGVVSFEIVRGKVPYKQLVLDGNKKFMLGSSTYVYNAKQLTLSLETMKAVSKTKVEDTDNKLLTQAYDEILDKVDSYMYLYDINKFREKLHTGREKFIELRPTEKLSTLKEVLNGLHDNSVLGNLKNIGISTPFGKMQMPSGITLTEKTILIYQSPTGLFEKRFKISKN